MGRTKSTAKEDQTKLCSECKISMPLEYFNKQKTGMYGASAKCKGCTRKYFDNDNHRKKVADKCRMNYVPVLLRNLSTEIF